MKIIYCVASLLVFVPLYADGYDSDLLDEFGSLLKKGRVERSLGLVIQTPESKFKNMTVLERWQNFETKLKEGANAAVKMALPHVVRSSGDMNISSSCISQSLQLLTGLKKIKPWAVKFLDASAKMFDGMFEGTLSTLGVYDECLDLEVFAEKGKNKGKLSFTGQYCTVEIRLPVPPKTRTFKVGDVLPELKNFSQGGTIVSEAAQWAELMNLVFFRWGLCIPSGCSEKDLSQVAAKMGEYIGLDTQVPRCEIKKDAEFSPFQIFIISLFSFIALIVVIATMLGVYVYYTKVQFKGLGMRILMCFNMITNFDKFTDTSTSGELLGCLNGIRFITMTWVVLGHTYVFINYDVFLGMKRAARFAEDFFFQAVLNSSVTVDTFYFIGGLLVTYLTVKLVKIEKHSLNLKVYVIHRLWRIMPVYLIVILVMFLMEHMGSGPVWYDTTHEVINFCRENWWTNLIFINNFYNSQRMCLPQSFYIASDMQLYFAALIILIPLVRSSRVGIIMCIVAILSCMVYTAVGTVVLGYPYAMIFSRPDPQQIQDYFAGFYFRPFIHVGAYCIGILTGYLLATNPKLKIPPAIQVIGWSLAFVTNFSLIYGIFEWNKGYDPPLAEGLSFSTVHRTFWALGVAWVVICCATGHGGIVNYILTSKAFVPLSRLSYSVYLIHPIVQVVFMGNIRTLLQPDNMIGVYLFFGHLCISYILAFVLCMCIESPTLAMQKLMKDALTRTSNDVNAKDKNVVLNGNFAPHKNGDVTMRVTDTFKDLRGIDNEAAVYKL